MKYISILAFSILLSLSGCNSKLEDPDNVDPSKSLVLTSSRDSVHSGGTAAARIIARVPKDAGILDISFTTTAGNFAQSGGKSIKQLSDSLSVGYRYAAVTLTSDATRGTVYVTAEAKTARTRLRLTFY